MPDHLLGLFLAEHELCRCQEPTERNLAELLLFQVLGHVHAHAQLAVALADVADEGGAAAGAQLEPAGCGQTRT